MENFNYLDAISRLEAIAAKVEDPATGLSDMDNYIRESASLVDKCRKYLRGCRDKADELDQVK